MLVVVDVPVAADEPPVDAAVDAAAADPRVLWTTDAVGSAAVDAPATPDAAGTDAAGTVASVAMDVAVGAAAAIAKPALRSSRTDDMVVVWLSMSSWLNLKSNRHFFG